MKIKAYKRFLKAYRSLPENVQRKIDKQIALLSKDFRNPSLHSKKIKGSEGIWEIRIDIHHRLTFEIIEDTMF
ncbi:MAG: type II toxin-antitoxin system RelE/ParE family toxin [Deltaproteobacteria bacterium]|nr:type II toxin-antitoxin system RelE/ParE family toxin [Deltaproteobacteria bacterium]